jgi:murein DD-endopeptidase MepM/ murein hydrolase activator NlpD
VSSPFGVRRLNGKDDLHTGVDVAASEGTPVFAMLPGRVVLAAPAGMVSGYGNVVVLEHGAQLFSLYAHLSQVLALEGQDLMAGQPLGLVGRTAGTPADPGKLFDSSGAHLHFEFLSQWPPHGKDLDRYDPSAVLAQLGIIVPQSGPLVLACSSSSSAPSSAASQPTTYELQPAPASSAGSSVGVVLALAALAYALAHR